MEQKELLAIGEKKLKQAKIEDAYLKAKKLLEAILKQTPEQFAIYCQMAVSQDQEQAYEKGLQEIMQGKPLQYITNHQEFMGLNFYVDEKVLIPQPDTEILVEEAISRIKQIQKERAEKTSQKNQLRPEEQPISVLDLGTGSGAIGISIAKYIEEARVTLSDISKQALEIAQKNSMLNEVESKTKWICSNVFENIQERFDIIVSNPPYIETSVIPSLAKEVQNEPMLALDGGKDGLDFYKGILQKAHEYLKPHGYLLLEIGYNQGKKVIHLWENHKKNLILVTQKPIKDFAGNDRVLIFKHEKEGYCSANLVF